MANETTISEALAASVKSGRVTDADSGAVALAKRYAVLLDAARGTTDEAKVLSDLGPKLQNVLTALGLTHAGRVLKGGVNGGPAPDGAASTGDPVADARAKRAAKANGTGLHAA